MIPAGAQFAPKAAEKTACQFIEIDEPLLPAPSRRSRRSGYEPPAGHMICAPTKGGPAAPQGCTTAAAARPAPAVSQGRLSAARRAHNMRPYERGPRCAAGLHGCRCCPPRPGGAVGAAISRPPGARCVPLRKGAPLRRSAARLPLLPAPPQRSRRGGYQPPAGRMICAPAEGLLGQTKAACQFPSIDTPLF